MNKPRFSLLIGLLLAVGICFWGFVPGIQAQSTKPAKPGPKPAAKSEQAAAKTEQSPVLETQKDKVSYAIGVNMIGNLKMQGIQYDPDLLMRGVKDALSGGNLLLTDSELRRSIALYQNELRRNQMKVRTMAAESNKKEGEAFLAENRNKEGVVSLPSGLQYKILKAGEGKMPTDADTVECHYRGTLINGTEFGDSHHTGNPAIFKVTSAIPGWREALKLMPVGSTWQLFMPPELAYGERGSSGSIGPNETLIYEVELIAIK